MLWTLMLLHSFLNPECPLPSIVGFLIVGSGTPELRSWGRLLAAEYIKTWHISVRDHPTSTTTNQVTQSSITASNTHSLNLTGDSKYSTPSHTIHRMSSQPSQPSSPHNSNRNPTRTPDPASQQVDPPSNIQTPSQGHRRQRSQSNPTLPSTPSSSAAPLIIVTGSPELFEPLQRARTEGSTSRQGRSLVSRHPSGHSSSQPPRRSSTPYARPRSQSRPGQRRIATTSLPTMSSASSSPGNTTTSGASAPSTSTASSNPQYHLPYAPFPYPMPGNARGQGQSGSGK